MATIYPNGLDSFNNPSPTDHLDDPLVLHHEQHENSNDSIAAIEDWIGISGSLVPYTLEFRLHNTSSGHNHNGINSAPVVLGPPETGLGPLYPVGYFSNFTNTTRVGDAIDRINRAMFSITSGSSIIFHFNNSVVNPSGTLTLNISGSTENISAFSSGSVTTYYFSESLKETSRKLILLANGGPFEGYANGATRVLGYDGSSVFVTESIWYTSSSLTQKIVAEKITYGPKKLITSHEWKAYASNGSTILTTITDSIFYNGIFEISRSRNIT